MVKASLAICIDMPIICSRSMESLVAVDPAGSRSLKVAARLCHDLCLQFPGVVYTSIQKRSCTVHRVRNKEPQVGEINPECPTTVCLIKRSWFWLVKLQKLLAGKRRSVRCSQPTWFWSCIRYSKSTASCHTDLCSSLSLDRLTPIV